MTMPTDFFTGSNWEQASGPLCVVSVQESDCWPVDTRSISGAKDTLAAGKHPVIAIGGMTTADGRPLNVTGVVVSYEGTNDSGIATDRVNVNIADGYIVRQWVANILVYPNTYETAPVVGQPVYVDDSAALSAGVTLSMAAINSSTTLKNPQAGILWYCQDEIADGLAGGGRAASTFDTSLANSLVEQEYCVLLFNGSREL